MKVFGRLSEDMGGSTPSLDRFWLGMAMVAVALAVAYGSYWEYMAESVYLEKLIAADRALIVFTEYTSTLLFVPVGLVAIAGITIIHIFYRDIFKRPLHRFVEFVQLGLYALMMLGFVLVMTGSFFMNSSWDSTFRENGYTECPNFVLRFNKNLMNEAWVTDPSFCFDDELHQILHEHHSRTGFEQAARYLERTYR